MDQNQPNQNVNTGEGAPEPEGGAQAPMPESGGKKPFGPTVGIIVIILVLLLGGFYFWWTQFRGTDMTAEEILNQADPALQALEQQDTSDEIAAIEADLEATDLEGLDAELDLIEQELDF